MGFKINNPFLKLNQSNLQTPDKSVVTLACIIIASVLTAVGSAVALFCISKLNRDYKKEHENLKRYEPQLTN